MPSPSVAPRWRWPAAAWQQRERWRGRSIGVPITGGNVDSDVYARVLAGGAA